MTIVDAARTGRRFKRPKWEAWYLLSDKYYEFKQEDILATDWIIEEPKPKRRLYIGEGSQLVVSEEPYFLGHIKPLSRKEFEALFEGDE